MEKLTFRLVGWHTDNQGARSVLDIREFSTTKTKRGTDLRIGRAVSEILSVEHFDGGKVEVVVEKRTREVETGS